MLAVKIDLSDPTPPFEQLRKQLAALIHSGQLVAGERLPPLRQLAGDLGLAVGTVARTYRELESAGLVRSRRGGGTTVCALSVDPVTSRSSRLAEAATQYAVAAAALGVTIEEAHDALDRQWTSGGGES